MIFSGPASVWIGRLLTILRMSSARASANCGLQLLSTSRNSSPPYRPTKSYERIDKQKAARDFLQDFVADEVAVRVVDGFEVIDVAEKHDRAAGLALRTHQFAAEKIHDDAAIPDGGERVVRGFEAHHFARFDEATLEMKDALAGAQTRFQFIDVERLGEVIVGAGLEARDDVFLRLFRSEQHHVDVGLFLLAAHFAANAGAIEFRHDPIEKSEARAVGLAELANRGAAVFNGDDFVSGALESFFEEAAGKRLVIGDQNFQRCTSAM